MWKSCSSKFYWLICLSILYSMNMTATTPTPSPAPQCANTLCLSSYVTSRLWRLAGPGDSSCSGPPPGFPFTRRLGSPALTPSSRHSTEPGSSICSLASAVRQPCVPISSSRVKPSNLGLLLWFPAPAGSSLQNLGLGHSAAIDLKRASVLIEPD